MQTLQFSSFTLLPNINATEHLQLQPQLFQPVSATSCNFTSSNGKQLDICSQKSSQLLIIHFLCSKETYCIHTYSFSSCFFVFAFGESSERLGLIMAQKNRLFRERLSFQVKIITLPTISYNLHHLQNYSKKKLQQSASKYRALARLTIFNNNMYKKKKTYQQLCTV